MISDKSIHIFIIHPITFHYTQVFVDTRLVKKKKTTTAQIGKIQLMIALQNSSKVRSNP